MVLEPLTAYPIPAGTRYKLLTVQKTMFGLDIIHETILPQLMENGFNLGDFRKMKRPPVAPVLITRPSTALATPQPVSIPEPSVLTTPQILLPDPPVQIPIFQPPVQTPAVPKTSPVQIPDPPVQIPVFQPPVPTTPPVQFFLPDPPPVQILLPPVVETLEPTPTDDSSIDQIMSVFRRLLATRASPGSYPRTPVA
ncbi:hypothetical protein TNCV_373431 [Trichonephila clavipes]|nr:hypothetical protein TNCV_373431 [Trichonephila clavipes]